MASKKRKIPSILLIGVGRFGEKHLQTLLATEKKGLITLVGAVVASETSKKKIEKKYGITVWTKINDDQLKIVSAVDIVTPPETHVDIALRCLPFTNVLIEKPLALSTLDAKRIERSVKQHKRVLMVGHIFRFDPVVKKLKLLLPELGNEPLSIKGVFVNPTSNDVGRDIPFEMSHLFDIVDFLFNKPKPEAISTTTKDRVNTTDIKYQNLIHVNFKYGWNGEYKSRTMSFMSSNKEIHADLLKNQIQVKDLANGNIKIIECSQPNDALTDEILQFLNILNGKTSDNYPDALTGIRIVEIAEQARTAKVKGENKRPKVAVIGAGIFGTNCAIELSKFCDVTVFEKNSDIMQEASFVNQYRHHWGYHYPRSSETVRDIRKAIGSFEKLYDKAIIRDFPTYYCIAKKGSKTSAEEYVEFCRKHELPFLLEYPDENYVDRDKISISLKTLEPIYNYEILKQLVDSQLIKSPHLTMKLKTSIANGSIKPDGKKVLVSVNDKGEEDQETFDFVVNATYAMHNQLAHWLHFPIKPVRIDLVETLIVKLDMPKISIAIMDGPFTNLVPTQLDNLFTLVHIKESILERYVPSNGLPSSKKPKLSKVKETLKKSAEWLPILSSAEVQEVRYVFRAVNAYREHDDARPSDITAHGFGCWSILGGKIVNCVETSKEIAEEIIKIYH